MATMTTNRKQRLRTLEKNIRKGMEEFYYVGQQLKEIRDDRLYEEDGFETWGKYCKEQWEWSDRHANRMIQASDYREKLPSGPTGSHEWSERIVRELTRIPDKKQAANVAKKVVTAVKESERKVKAKGEGKPLKLSASTIKKFVDEDLGLPPKPKTSTPKADPSVDLIQLVRDYSGELDGMIRVLKPVTPDAWTLLEKSHPGWVERLATRCDRLASLLRSDWT